MIYYIVAVHDRIVYSEWTEKSLKSFPQSIVIEVEDEENDSIFKKYNRGLQRYMRLTPSIDDQVCFIHEDVKILDPNFEQKIDMAFKMKPDTGILGVIGSTEYAGQGWWHVDRSKHFGQIEQGLSNGKSYRMVKKVGFNQDMVVVDGCCMVFSGKMAQNYRFDEERFPGAYHFYDVDACLECLEGGHDVVAADILIHHKSEGPMNAIWHRAQSLIVQKWQNKGYQFPLDKKRFR